MNLVEYFSQSFTQSVSVSIGIAKYALLSHRLTNSIENCPKMSQHYYCRKHYSNRPKKTRQLFNVFLVVVVILAGFVTITQVNGFLLEKLERLKRLPLLSTLFPSLSNSLFSSSSPGVRVCIKFTTDNNAQSYQQNTCFSCDPNRFTQIATYCTGHPQIPDNINYTEANCIMNTCRPNSLGPQQILQQKQQQQQSILMNPFPAMNYPN